MQQAVKKKKTTYKMRKILYAKKTPPLYFSRLNQQATIAFMRNNSFFNISGRLREEPDYLFSNFY
jgi:hypothetical protein